jgi:hypothetical protein
MIPWFIVNVIDAITARLGYDMTVECRSDRRWAVERFWLHRRPPGTPRPAKLGPYRGGPLVAADEVGTIFVGNDVALAGVAELRSCRELTRADPFATRQ